MAYSDKVIDHYNNPRNVGALPKEDPNVGTGLVGAPECGDVMKLQIKVNEESGVIEDAKFKTFGCGSAIASSSLATEWVKGKTIDEALQIRNTDIVNELSLPPVKIHCSVLAEDAIRAALSDYRSKQAAPGAPAPGAPAAPHAPPPSRRRAPAAPHGRRAPAPPPRAPPAPPPPPRRPRPGPPAPRAPHPPPPRTPPPPPPRPKHQNITIFNASQFC